MADCCTSNSKPSSNPNKRCCPVDNSEYVRVNQKTIQQHLKSPWRHPLTAQHYYFCSNPECDVVYFGDDDSLITTSEVRELVGQKQTGKDRILCYCFGITLADAENDPTAKTYVIQQTKEGLCSCETRNPSGRCCLKDFPKPA